MPWNNNSGGGGWKGGGGGPWGAGPQQRGPQPPDLEELLRRSQDRLRNVLPGGRARQRLDRRPGRARRWSCSGWSKRLHGAAGRARPGAGLRQARRTRSPRRACISIFWPVETVEKVPTRVQREFIGSDDQPPQRRRRRNLMLSADQNIVEINFSVLWRVGDPKKFLFNVERAGRIPAPRRPRAPCASWSAARRAEEVRTERRAEVEEGVRAARAGHARHATTPASAIVGVQLERADPPAEVADAFEEVQRAQQDLDRFQREAEQYANRRLGDARGEAAQVTETGASATSSRSWRRRRASRSASSPCSPNTSRPRT